MASIQGLTQEQCKYLARVQVGDLVLIEKVSPANYYATDEGDGGSEDNEDAVNGEDVTDGNTSENEEDGEGGRLSENSHDHVALDCGDEDEGTTAVETEDQASDGDAESEADTEDGEDGTYHDVHEATLYKVHSITKNAIGIVTDIALYSLTYSVKLANAVPTSFAIYGNELVASSIAPVKNDALELITDITSDESIRCSIFINPTGNQVRNIMFEGYCPAACREGWVRTQQEMHDMILDPLMLVTEHEPVCPVCMGKALTLEYQSLRETLFSTPLGNFDIGAVVEFHGRLNMRRRELGYEFKQFDEREWGYLFNDMVDDGTDGDNDQWEALPPEATDLSSNIVLHPASDAAIAQLPRKRFGDAKNSKGEDVGGGECLICKDKFAEGTVVVEMPCGHFFCDSGCIEQWLKQFNTCPTCRCKILSKNDDETKNS